MEKVPVQRGGCRNFHSASMRGRRGTLSSRTHFNANSQVLDQDPGTYIASVDLYPSGMMTVAIRSHQVVSATQPSSVICNERGSGSFHSSFIR